MVHKPYLGLCSILNIRAFPINIWISNFFCKIRKDGTEMKLGESENKGTGVPEEGRMLLTAAL